MPGRPVEFLHVGFFFGRDEAAFMFLHFKRSVSSKARRRQIHKVDIPRNDAAVMRSHRVPCAIDHHITRDTIPHDSNRCAVVAWRTFK
jgi:hypothetical protein